MRRLFVTAVLLLWTSGCGMADPSSHDDRLRITNASNVPIQDLVVLFPTDRVSFGTLAPGGTTTYRNVPNGVYSYSAFEATVNGATIRQPVIDWVGAEPMDGEAFTYVIDLVDQSGRVFINIVRTTRDR
jgi:hypothetical protein